MRLKKVENILLVTIEALESGSLKFGLHAIEQMESRRITLHDVYEAIYNGSREISKDDYRQNKISGKWSWRYSIRGKNEFGDKDLRIIISIENPRTIVVTVIDLNRNE